MTTTETSKASTTAREPAAQDRSLVYRRLVLRISADPRSPGDLVTEVLESPVGQTGRARFEVPLGPEELAQLAGAARRHVRPTPTAAPSSQPLDPSSVGHTLAEALFVGPVARALHGGLEAVRGRPDTGLRIELRIDPTLAQAPSLHALPWELLTLSHETRPLSLSRWTPVVRYLELPRGSRPPPRPERLRILVVAPRPRGFPPLDQALEIEQLCAAWEPFDRVEVKRLESPTLEALWDELRAQPADGLHFMGHGRFDHERGVGELLFEDSAGEPDPVAADLLAGQVADFAGRIRIVVVNACQSARPGVLEPGLGVAHALVATGVPAVVAMQFPVSDQAALSFSRSLYRSLAENEPVDAAVADGRQAIQLEVRGDTMAAATPVLFLSVEDGRLFAPAETKPTGGEAEGPSMLRRIIEGLVVSVVAGLLLLLLSTLPWSRGGANGITDHPGGREPPARSEAGREDGPAMGPEDEPASGGPTLSLSGMVPETAGKEETDERPTAGPGTEGDRAVPVIHTLAAGETVPLPEVSASVRVDFLSQNRVDFVRVAVRPEGEEVVRRVVVGPETLMVEAGGRTLSIHVLGIDWAQHTVELEATRSP